MSSPVERPAVNREHALRSAIDELRRSEARLEAIVNNAADGIVTINQDCIIESFNRAAVEIFGYAPTDVIGLNINVLMPEPVASEHDESVRAYLHSNVGRVINRSRDVMGRRSDGEVFPMSLHLSEVNLPGGRIFTGLVRDISEQERVDRLLRENGGRLEAANRNLDEARRDADRANEAKSAFLANMSHEIRTPLNGVIGMTSVLLDSGLSTDQRDIADTIMRSGEILLQVLNNILDFSKGEAGMLTLETVQFDVPSLVEETIDLVRVRANAKRNQLTAVIDRDVPKVLMGDAGRIRQVLINLVGNAVKFTGHGGVTIHISQSERTAGSVVLRVEVVDTGIGIEEEAQGSLFESFTQADVSTTRRFGGSGLGLSICKQLTSLAGGDIGVRNRLGEGSTFWFTMPLGIPSAEAPLHESVTRSSGTNRTWSGGEQRSNARVLVAEDNPVNQCVMKRILESLGLRVDIVENGREALEAVQMQDYALVLMDCQMPEMDGLQATAAIRAIEAFTHLPIVALTAGALPGDRSRCLEAGMSDYLAKPFQRVELLRILDRWIPIEPRLAAV